jgi:hypothetical protein
MPTVITHGIVGLAAYRSVAYWDFAIFQPLGGEGDSQRNALGMASVNFFADCCETVPLYRREIKKRNKLDS